MPLPAWFGVSVGCAQATGETIAVMSVLQFIASLASSLGWPIAALTLGLIFRRQLMAILAKLVQRMERLTKMRAGSFEAEFAESAPDLLETKPKHGLEQRSVAPTDALTEKQRDLIERARRLADIDPRSAVLAAGRALEATMNEILRSLGIPYGEETRVPGLPRRFPGPATLTMSGVISEKDCSRLQELRQLRNAAAHDTPENITIWTALDYVDAVERMLVVLNEGEERYRSRSA